MLGGDKGGDAVVSLSPSAIIKAAARTIHDREALKKKGRACTCVQKLTLQAKEKKVKYNCGEAAPAPLQKLTLSHLSAAARARLGKYSYKKILCVLLRERRCCSYSPQPCPRSCKRAT